MKKIDYNEYTDESFTDAEALQTFFRSGKTLKYDYVIVEGKLFTMEEYDMDGKEIMFANRKYEKQLNIVTTNRYGSLGFTDAKVYMWDATSWRNDITYAE